MRSWRSPPAVAVAAARLARAWPDVLRRRMDDHRRPGCHGRGPAAPVQRALAGGHDRRLPGDARAGRDGLVRPVPGPAGRPPRDGRAPRLRARPTPHAAMGRGRDHADRAALRERLREPVLGCPDRLRRGDRDGPRRAPPARRRPDAPGTWPGGRRHGTPDRRGDDLGLRPVHARAGRARRPARSAPAEMGRAAAHPGRALRGVVPDPRAEHDRDLREPVHARDPGCAPTVHRRWDGDGVRLRGRRRGAAGADPDRRAGRRGSSTWPCTGVRSRVAPSPACWRSPPSTRSSASSGRSSRSMRRSTRATPTCPGSWR